MKAAARLPAVRAVWPRWSKRRAFTAEVARSSRIEGTKRPDRIPKSRVELTPDFQSSQGQTRNSSRSSRTWSAGPMATLVSQHPEPEVKVLQEIELPPFHFPGAGLLRELVLAGGLGAPLEVLALVLGPPALRPRAGPQAALWAEECPPGPSSRFVSLPSSRTSSASAK